MDNNTAEYGVFIDDIEELGKGYGTDALNQMINLAFNVLRLKTLTLKTLSYNKVAIKTYINAGFVEQYIIVEGNIESDMIREVIIIELVNRRE